MIPKACLDREKMTLARGVSDLFDIVLVKHYGPDGEQDGWSEMKFKSYERGRTKWQGEQLDFIWYDEEPDEEIYLEGLARITATNGLVFVTFTPLEGMSKVVLRFLNEKSPDRGVVTMTIEDAKHIPVSERAKIIAGFPDWQREARAYGIPMLGSGKIFQVAESMLREDPFPIPAHWRFLWGFDFGMDHPFGAVLLAWDVDADCIHVIHTIRMKDSMPLQHVEAMKPFGLDVPVAWPQDGWQRKEFGGALKPVALIYKKHGASMCHHHATFEDGSNSTEAGLLQMNERMRTNRFKVFNTCSDWFEEYRLYHRKDGEIVKVNDDLMSATRVGVMARRCAKAVKLYRDFRSHSNEPQIAKGVDDDPWGEQ
jgi:phage terminase large subunit-like protein